MSTPAGRDLPVPAATAWRYPPARALRREGGAVQFGLHGDRGVVLSGLSHTESAWLLSLPTQPRSVDLDGSGARWGLAPQRVAELVALLHAHGLVRSEPPSRQARPVVVIGTGPLPLLVRGQLRRCGLTVVGTSIRPCDPPELAVLVGADALTPHDSRSWAESEIVHLPALVCGGRAVVGPLVARAGDPCLFCLELARRDHDPQWPQLLSQLAPHSLEAGTSVQADPALATTVAGVVAMLTQAHLDGIPVPAGVTWEVALPSPTVTTRRWTVHPRCPVPHQPTGQAATGFLRGRPRGRLRATTTPESSS